MNLGIERFSDGWAVVVKTAAGINPVGNRLVKSPILPPALPWRGFRTAGLAEAKADEWRTFLSRQAAFKATPGGRAMHYQEK